MTVLSGSISPQMGGAIRVPIDSGERFCVNWREATHKNERSSMCRCAAACYD